MGDPMRMDEIFWQETTSVVKKELENIVELREELNNVIKGEDKTNNRRLFGSILHDFYNCCERIFRRIATDMEPHAFTDVIPTSTPPWGLAGLPQPRCDIPPDVHSIHAFTNMVFKMRDKRGALAN